MCRGGKGNTTESSLSLEIFSNAVFDFQQAVVVAVVVVFD
jgi:hypothetical protein